MVGHTGIARYFRTVTLLLVCALVGSPVACKSSSPGHRTTSWGGQVKRNWRKGFLNGQVELKETMSQSERQVAKKLSAIELEAFRIESLTLQQLAAQLQARSGVRVLYATPSVSNEIQGECRGGSFLIVLDELARKFDFTYQLNFDDHTERDRVLVVLSAIAYTRDTMGLDGLVSVVVVEGFPAQLGLQVPDGVEKIDCAPFFEAKGVPFPCAANGYKAFAQYDPSKNTLTIHNFRELTKKALAILRKMRLLEETAKSGS